jgi:hypothetical protein
MSLVLDSLVFPSVHVAVASIFNSVSGVVNIVVAEAKTSNSTDASLAKAIPKDENTTSPVVDEFHNLNVLETVLSPILRVKYTSSLFVHPVLEVLVNLSVKSLTVKSEFWLFVIFQLNTETSSFTVFTTFVSLDLEVFVMLNLAAFILNLATVTLPAISAEGAKELEEFWYSPEATNAPHLIGSILTSSFSSAVEATSAIILTFEVFEIYISLSKVNVPLVAVTPERVAV